MNAFPLPSRRYIPGAGGGPDRPPLDAAKATIAGPMQPERWGEHVAYRYGARLHVGCFFWEAHEVWEAVWLTCAHNSAERRLLRGLIQTANAGLKLAMNRPQAVRRLLLEAAELFPEVERGAEPGPFMGVDLYKLRAAVLAPSSAEPAALTSSLQIRAPLFSLAGLDNGDTCIIMHLKGSKEAL